MAEKILQDATLRVTLKVEAPRTDFAPLDARRFKIAIDSALRELYGQLGGSGHRLDLLPGSDAPTAPHSASGILLIDQRSLVPVWTALTLFGTFEGHVCCFEIEQVSPWLMGLACPRHLDVP